MSIKLDRIATELIEKKLINESQAQTCMSEAQKEKKDFFNILLTKKWVDETELSKAVAEFFKMPHYDWDLFSPQMIPKNSIDEKFFIEHHVLPVEELKEESTGRGILRVVVAYPDKELMRALTKMGASSRFKIEILIGNAQTLADAIETHFGQFTGSLISAQEMIDSLKSENSVMENSLTPMTDDEESNPLIKYINQLLRDAIRLRASDLHFEPLEDGLRVRFRVDGVLQLVDTYPANTKARFIARLKVMSNMDIAENRKPQDGRIRYKISETKTIDFRVNSLPTVHGEKIVLRILDPSSAKLGIDALGYEPQQKELLLEALNKPQGMILITGPTGSGKTVSLYTGLNILNTIDRNISTAEDPVEINLNGITQVNVNLKTGLTFASALRSFLRQDPDIIMVGEIRDLETAEIAIKAAQTGHMVMSTLHTNSAPETLTRLRNMGVPSFNIATSVNLVIAQRLARRLCHRCRKPSEVNHSALIEIGFKKEELESPETRIYEAAEAGCNACTNGYKGRVGIYEVVKIDKEISNLIMNDSNAIEIATVTERLGFPNLRRSGIKKVLDGHTTVSELMRVTG